jgi:hypothetical protein
MSGTTTDAAAQEPAAQAPQETQPAGGAPAPEPPGFRSRGSARRRARFLRKARELGYRDLGGLVFNLHRFGQRNDALVLAKLTTLGHIDTELRALEDALHERRPVTVLREAGITACARCAAIHSSEDNFCPNCGLPMRRHVEVMADLRSGVPAQAPAPATPTPSVPAPASAAAPPVATPGPIATPAPAPNAPASGAEDSAPAPERARPTTGRSPSPPSAAPAPSSAPATRAAPATVEEDSPTEIISPPVPGP